jgi:hypothetical protein
MGNEIQRAFEVKGMKVPTDANGFVSLTGIWIAAGRTKGKNPDFWLRTNTAKEFVASVTTSQKCDVVRRVNGGDNKGTWGHWQVALAYAKWLSPEIHQFVNEGFRQWQAEEKNPHLGVERAVKNYLKLGVTPEWIRDRFDSIVTRKEFTSAMKDHNCKTIGSDNPYAEATRSIALAVIGKTPKEIRIERGVKKSEATRDAYKDYELVRTRFAESESKKLIQEEAADGNVPCLAAVGRACQAVKVAIQSLASPKGSS